MQLHMANASAFLVQSAISSEPKTRWRVASSSSAALQQFKNEIKFSWFTDPIASESCRPNRLAVVNVVRGSLHVHARPYQFAAGDRIILPHRPQIRACRVRHDGVACRRVRLVRLPLPSAMGIARSFVRGSGGGALRAIRRTAARKGDAG